LTREVGQGPSRSRLNSAVELSCSVQTLFLPDLNYAAALIACWLLRSGSYTSPLTHNRCSSTASLRATATTARFVVEMGFTPEMVGRAVREIPDSKLVARDYSDKDSLVLALLGRMWVWMSPKSLELDSQRNSIVVVPFQQIISNLNADLKRRFDKKSLREHYPEIYEEVYRTEK
jgi:hypothetical protein